MHKPLYPCLWFDGKASEAAGFYCSVFPDSVVKTENPLVTSFELNGQLLMGLNGGPMFTMNPSISMFVYCKTISETNAIWSKLLDGGSFLMPIDQYPWSKRYGWLQDKYGLSWQISVADDENAPMKIMPSMLFSGSQFGRAEEAIRFYSSVFVHASTEVMFHYPPEDPNAGKVLYSEFQLNQSGLIAMDGPGEHDFVFNEAISFVVNCDSQEEIDYFWEKLSDGGEESQCGWLKDKFGVSWQIVPSILGELMSDPVRSEKVIQAFLKMNKFEIDKLLTV